MQKGLEPRVTANRALAPQRCPQPCLACPRPPARRSPSPASPLAGSCTSPCSPGAPPRLGPAPGRHWSWGGHSGRRRWARSARPVPGGQGDNGSLGGGAGRTSKIRCSDRCARWIPPDGVQSLRLAPSARPPVPRVTWSPHRPQGRSSPPCVAQPRGNPQGCPRVTCPRGAGGREAGPGSPRAPRPGCRPSLATWAAGSLQTLHTVPEVDTASRTPVGTAEGEHGVPGLAALP